MKLLVADDDADLRDLIGFTLTQAGYLVIKAADGPAALKLVSVADFGGWAAAQKTHFSDGGVFDQLTAR